MWIDTSHMKPRKATSNAPVAIAEGIYPVAEIGVICIAIRGRVVEISRESRKAFLDEHPDIRNALARAEAEKAAAKRAVP